MKGNTALHRREQNIFMKSESQTKIMEVLNDGQSTGSSGLAHEKDHILLAPQILVFNFLIVFFIHFLWGRRRRSGWRCRDRPTSLTLNLSPAAWRQVYFPGNCSMEHQTKFKKWRFWSEKMNFRHFASVGCRAGGAREDGGQLFLHSDVNWLKKNNNKTNNISNASILLQKHHFVGVLDLCELLQRASNGCAAVTHIAAYTWPRLIGSEATLTAALI